MIFVVILAIALVALAAGFIGGVYAERYRGVPLWQVEDRWSIGIYAGESPFNLTPAAKVRNPVLTARDVTDNEQTSFVADPFMVKEDSTWHMFFEVMDAKSYKGKIALASSADALTWTYQGIVLCEPYHLSYPYVFKWKNDYFMIPESSAANAVRLYRADRFPKQWSFVSVLLTGKYVDGSVFRYGDRWWLFAANPSETTTLRLFYSDELAGPWVEHLKSPVIKGNAHIARPGGRVLVFDDRVVRYAQDGAPNYGAQLRAFEIVELTTETYEEREVTRTPVLQGSGNGWNSEGMHHIDPHQINEGVWLACVDGNRRRTSFRLNY
jgi:hypothetical protein